MTISPSGEKAVCSVRIPSSAMAAAATSLEALRVLTRRVTGGTPLLARQISTVCSVPNWARRRLTSQGGWEWMTVIASCGSCQCPARRGPCPFGGVAQDGVHEPRAAGETFLAIPTASFTAAKGGILSVYRSWYRPVLRIFRTVGSRVPASPR